MEITYNMWEWLPKSWNLRLPWETAACNGYQRDSFVNWWLSIAKWDCGRVCTPPKNLARNPVFVCFCGNMRSKVILQRVRNSLCGFHGTVGSRRVHHAILSKYRAQRQACQTQHFRCMRRWMNCANVYLYSNPWPLCFHELSLNAWTFFASLDPFRTLYLRKILFFCLSLSLSPMFFLE